MTPAETGADAAARTRLTLGISPCPNDVYIFAGVILGRIDTGGLGFDVDYQDVETLNGAARERAAYDVVKISYANAVHVEREYELLDCGGALGRGVGPLLLVNGADGGDFDPAREEVLVPGEYTTANFLLDFYLGRPVRKRFVPFDVLYAELCNRPGAQGVVIHEKRFTYAADGLTLVRDLGEHWEGRTGFAIPLGCIAVRRGIADVPAERIARVVRASLAWADANPGETFDLCRRYAQDLTDGVIQSHIGLYVNEYSRDLGPEGAAAVAHFLGEQRRLRAAGRSGISQGGSIQ
ncbi:MAG TPA: 1,4-dihydroxy-6-naphthoate synthase [Armatimonadaceae bacterium]|nr:1,4-dihydroxy-6-naphthoate synthase [Armatimonadaceae bacterium]